MFKVVFKKKASKELFKLPLTILKKISIQIDSLQFNPKPEGVKKLKVSEENLWRLRVGDYRIIYLIEDDIKIIEIRKIGHRKDVYKKKQ